jgi:hypothetical protein
LSGHDGTLDAALARFVDAHVRSLVSWEILVFFDSHRGAVLDESALAKRLGRRPADITADVDALCRGKVLECGGGLIRFGPDPETGHEVGRFAAAGATTSMRRQILGRILPRIDAAVRLQAEGAGD